MSTCYSVVSVLFPTQNMMSVSGVQNGYINYVVVVVAAAYVYVYIVVYQYWHQDMSC